MKMPANRARVTLEDESSKAVAYQDILEHLSDELRQYLCYMPDGKLFVSKSHRFHPPVTSFMGRLRRLEMPCFPQYVDLSVIANMRDKVEAEVGDRSASDMERAARSLFERAVKSRASDIHIRCSDVTNTSIHMRIHGDLEFVEEHTLAWGRQFCTAIYQSIADIADTSFDESARQDARIADRNRIPSGLDGIRIATTPQVGGFAMVLRLLYNDTVDSFDLGLLGYTKQQCNAIELMKRRPTGINIIAGPTGSGKSTTLQRTLGSIVKETCGRKHVITVEDPPEYPIPGTVQTPVTNAETDEERSREFQGAIKTAMRLDPDVIMIGEIRDTPSATLAVRAAMTGHQVWTTLHANGGFAILDRLLDLGVPLEMLTDHTIITGLTCQRLVKVLCPHCRIRFAQAMERYSPSDIQRIMSVVDVEHVYVTGEGCEHCRNSGTIGRTVVAETIITDATLMTFIRNRDRIKALDYWRTAQQGKTMLAHAIDKISVGEIDPFAAEDIVGPLNMGMIESDHRIDAREIASVVA